MYAPLRPSIAGMSRAALARPAALFALVLLAPWPAAAQLICTEPLVPICAQDLDTITSEQQQALCLDDLKRFETQLDEYVSCVRDTAEEAETRRTAAADFRTCLEEKGAAACEPLE